MYVTPRVYFCRCISPFLHCYMLSQSTKYKPFTCLCEAHHGKILSLIAVLPIIYISSILKTLQTCVDKGREEAIPPRWHRKLKAKWWSKVIPYFLHACSCGSLRAVECFIASGHKPNSRYIYTYIYVTPNTMPLCLHVLK